MTSGETAPKVSIGLPVYNGAEYLRTALESILGQTFADLEIVISDNASTDDTPRICLEFADRDSRIRYSRNRVNEGALFNFNRVFDLSRGEYFKWAGHDDWISPRFIESCVAEIERDPSIVLVYGRMCRVDRVLVVQPEPIVRSSSAALRFHESLWRLPYYPIFGLFRASALRATNLLTNKPEPDRVLLAEMALQGRCRQVPYATLFQRSPLRDDTWVWLHPENVKKPFVNAFRSTGALGSVLLRSSELAPAEKAILVPDLLAFQAVSRVRGKARQYRKRIRRVRGTGRALDVSTIEGVVERLLEEERRSA